MELKEKIYRIIYRTETPSEKLYDLILIWTIILSVITVILDSVSSISTNFRILFKILEWFFTIIFTLDYFTRIYVVRNKKKYIFSFFGIIDLLATLPTYISLFVSGMQILVVIRIIRLLRIFRILKMIRYSEEAQILLKAFDDSKRKIIVFLFSLVIIIIIIGSIMFIVEGPENGFVDIPTSMYWAVVTMTTVGFGDITPNTVFGKFLASLLMILGYAIIAVPTGIFTVEMSKNIRNRKTKNIICSKCSNIEYDLNSKFCKICGKKLKK
jgi:voltage-gated potassium channel